MNRADYYDLKGWSRDEHELAALSAQEEHRELLLIDAWDALWIHQHEPDDTSEAYYRRCMASWEGEE